jgi:hypothetical protein
MAALDKRNQELLKLERGQALTNLKIEVLERAERGEVVDRAELRRQFTDMGGSIEDVDTLMNKVQSIYTQESVLDMPQTLNQLNAALSQNILTEQEVWDAFTAGEIRKSTRETLINSLRVSRDRTFTDPSFKVAEAYLDDFLPIKTIPGLEATQANIMAENAMRNMSIRNTIMARVRSEIASGELDQSQVFNRVKILHEQSAGQLTPHAFRIQNLGPQAEIRLNAIIRTAKITPETAAETIEQMRADLLKAAPKSTAQFLGANFTAADIEAIIYAFKLDDEITREKVINGLMGNR